MLVWGLSILCGGELGGSSWGRRVVWGGERCLCVCVGGLGGSHQRGDTGAVRPLLGRGGCSGSAGRLQP